MSELDFYWDVSLYTKTTKETVSLWKECVCRLPGDTLFITGIGFDPRAYESFKILFDNKLPQESFYCLGLKSAAEAVGANSDQREIKNINKLKTYFGDRLKIEECLRTETQSTSLALCILLKKLEREDYFKRFNQIIVDIGAMPRVTFLTLIPILLNLFVGPNGELDKTNLLVIALENAEFDNSFTGHVIDSQATFLHQYKGQGPSASPDLPGVWFPVMGASRELELKTIQRDIQKALKQEGVEVLPILPFPATNPRLSDEIIGRFYHVLFEEFEVNYSNLLYAAEDNPFHLYRRLMKSFVKYAKNFAVLGGGRFFVSPLSGKLMSVGAILAIYEANRELSEEKNKAKTKLLTEKEKLGNFYFGVPLVEPNQYKVEKSKVDFSKAELSLLWLLGEAYES